MNTAATSPGTMANDATVGTIAWTNPNNAKVSDNVYATASNFGGTTTNYLKATNFGFSIPAGATINGMIVEIERKTNNPGAGVDNAVRIVKGGVIGSTNKASGVNWTGSDTYATYGSSSDLWGETWNGTDINDSIFGVVISAKDTVGESATLTIDHIRITVYYTALSSTITSISSIQGIQSITL